MGPTDMGSRTASLEVRNARLAGARFSPGIVESYEEIGPMTNVGFRARSVGQARRVLERYAQEVLLGGVLVALIVFFSIFGQGFLSQINITGIGQSATETGLLAIAETFVIVTGGIDLSVGAILGLAGVVGAKVMATNIGGGVPGVDIGAGIVVGLLVAVPPAWPTASWWSA